MIKKIVVTIGIVCFLLFSMGGPVGKGPNQGAKAIDQSTKAMDARLKLSPERFRVILLGDSQTTGPNFNDIRVQTHRWDAPILGEFVAVGNSVTGFSVHNSNAGISNLLYQDVDMNTGWPNGGAYDFIALNGANWTCGGDIDAPSSTIGRYRLRFGTANTLAPWDEPWIHGSNLVARIAIRTSPECVASITTRAERGGQILPGSTTNHSFLQVPGVQIIEQRITADYLSNADEVGVGLYFSDGYVEQPGQVLQVLGVLIERVGPNYDPLDGTLIGYQGRGGWNMKSHIDKISPAARSAMIRLFDPDYLMVMLGHNSESGGAPMIQPRLDELLGLWDASFAEFNRERPPTIFVTPWAIIQPEASPYLRGLEQQFQIAADARREDIMVSYLPRFGYLRPDVYDPSSYQLDSGGVHSGDADTAVNLSQDLYDMLFHPK